MKKILMKTIFVLFIILTLTSCDKETNTEETDLSSHDELKDAISGIIVWDDYGTKKVYLETKDTTYFGDFDIYLNDVLILDSKDYNYCIPAQTTIEVDVDLDVNKTYNYKTVVGKNFVWMDADTEINTDTSDLQDGDSRYVCGETDSIYGLTKVDLKKGKNILVFPQRHNVDFIYNKSSNFSITERYYDEDKEAEFYVAYCELTATKDYGMQTGDLLANSGYISYVVQGNSTDEVISIDARHEVYKTDYTDFDLLLLCSQEVLNKYGDAASDKKYYYYKVTFPQDVEVIVSNDDYIISSNNNEFVVNSKPNVRFRVKGINDFGTNVTFKVQKCYCD